MPAAIAVSIYQVDSVEALIELPNIDVRRLAKVNCERLILRPVFESFICKAYTFCLSRVSAKRTRFENT